MAGVFLLIQCLMLRRLVEGNKGNASGMEFTNLEVSHLWCGCVGELGGDAERQSGTICSRAIFSGMGEPLNFLHFFPVMKTAVAGCLAVSVQGA